MVQSNADMPDIHFGNGTNFRLLSPRYEAYARANASIGINATVINNVNASPKILSNDYLQKVKVLADVFRPYGLKIYLSINFSSPAALGGLSTSDPLNKEVINWWKQKAKEIYSLIPDFGGFLVKANSEGQPVRVTTDGLMPKEPICLPMC